MDRGVDIINDNKELCDEPEHLSVEEADELRIIGRAVWSGGAYMKYSALFLLVIGPAIAMALTPAEMADMDQLFIEGYMLGVVEAEMNHTDTGVYDCGLKWVREGRMLKDWQRFVTTNPEIFDPDAKTSTALWVRLLLDKYCAEAASEP